MRFLFCANAFADSVSAGHVPQTAFLRDMVKAGHEINVLVSSDNADAFRSYEVSPTPASIEVCIADEKDKPLTDNQNFAQLIAGRLSSNHFDGVLAVGMGLNGALVENETIAARLWSLLPPEEVDAMLNLGEDGSEYLKSIAEHSRLTIVGTKGQQSALRKLSPSSYHKIVSQDTLELGTASATFSSLVNAHTAERRVLLYRDPGNADPQQWASATYRLASSLASAQVHVFLMCHGSSSIFQHCRAIPNDFISVLEPASAAHQIAEGRLHPRFAAWHVAVAADQLNCNAVLSDDLELVSFGFSNIRLRSKLWPVFQFKSLGEFNAQKETFQGLLEWVNRVVLVDEDQRAVLESRIPSATSKTVLLPTVWGASQDSPQESGAEVSPGTLLKRNLDRFEADYISTPRMQSKRRLLMAGHDFKFAGELLDVLARRDDVELRADHWTAQNVQDEASSRLLLDWAEVIFCEFASHNAVWYSWEKKRGQTLIVRFHGYELQSPWIQDINLANVDKMVFVSEFYRDKVVGELGWPREKTAVISNMIDVMDLNRPKQSDARFHLGMAGIVPILKRPDRALDILERLLAFDSRYTLHVRGRAPWEYGWMWQNADIRDAYEAFYERLASNPHLRRRVAFEEFGPDMGRWFQRIGWMLSPSYRETFHLAPVEGMASGAVPIVWERDGAQEIFGAEWVHPDTDAAVNYILWANKDQAKFSQLSAAAQQYAQQFDIVENGLKWLRLIFDTDGVYSALPSANVQADRAEASFEARSDAVSFARLVSVLLRDGDKQRAQELATAHPEFAEALPPQVLWMIGIERLNEEVSLIPQRALGSAYLARQNTVLYAIEGSRMSKQDFSWPASMTSEIGSGAIRLVTVRSGDDDQDAEAERGARHIVEVAGAQVVSVTLRNTQKLRVDKFVLAAADALVREARTFRPAAIAAHSTLKAAMPALIAARRLGIPFILESGEELSGLDSAKLLLRVREQSDAVFASSRLPLSALPTGIKSYMQSTDLSVQRELSSLKVGIIADEFTTNTIGHSFTTVPLSRMDGYLQVASSNLDAIFIESAWEGPENEWRRGVAYYPEQIDDLKRIIMVAKARQIPVVFWNKEDPVHFRAFAKTAAMADHVFTTDADMVGKYLGDSGSTAKTSSAMPFYAEPAIHNPMPTDRPYKHSVSYAGTYYGDRFKERSIELQQILDAAKRHGLTIYDRQVNVPNSPYRFPPELTEFVQEGVPYHEVLKVYKAHPVNINVNSANDSPTMFSRRVVEIAASGSVVLSGLGRGITEQIPSIEASGFPDRWAELLGRWMTDEHARLAEAWKQMRAITRSHLAEHALTILMRTAGVSVAARQLPTYAVVIQRLESTSVAALLRQTWRPAAVYTDQLSKQDSEHLRLQGITVGPYKSGQGFSGEWFAHSVNVASDSYFEDLLHATRFGEWDLLAGRLYDESDGVGNPLVELKRSGTFAELQRRGLKTPARCESPLTWVMTSDV